jgi:hypothetical protein
MQNEKKFFVNRSFVFVPAVIGASANFGYKIRRNAC